MGLETYDQSTPNGNSALVNGDNKIKELAQKTCASVAAEHTLAGIHAIPHGTYGDRPAAGNAGRLYVVDDPLIGYAYLQYDNGDEWVVCATSIDTEADLASHTIAPTIDHPDGSVTAVKLADGAVISPKIAGGALKRVHFDSGSANPQDSVSVLVNGSELDSTWHTHPAGAVGGGITFFDTFTTVASGTTGAGWTNLDLSAQGVPDEAIGVILQASGEHPVNHTISESFTCNILARKSEGDGEVILTSIGSDHGVYVGGGITALRSGGQSMVAVDTGATMQYKVDGFNTSWEIKLVGYIE